MIEHEVIDDLEQLKYTLLVDYNQNNNIRVNIDWVSYMDDPDWKVQADISNIVKQRICAWWKNEFKITGQTSGQ